MGSSPVTATTLPEVVSQADDFLRRFLVQTTGWRRGRPVVVAFSGGPDSTALLAACVRVVNDPASVYSAHYDHRLDPDSGRRAGAASQLAADLGASWVSEKADPEARMRFGVEDWARRRRYEFLERIRSATGAVAVLTAHHLEDQAETVLLRLMQGSGVRGLAAIQPWIAGVGRPWLKLSRSDLRRLILQDGLDPVEDPSNRDLTVPRNLVRHTLLPRLRTTDPDIDRRLAHLAASSAAARARIEEALRTRLDVSAVRSTAEPGIDLEALRALPRDLWPWGLALLGPGLDSLDHPVAGGRRSVAELARQMDSGCRVAVALPNGDRWAQSGARLVRTTGATDEVDSTYCHDLDLPGEVELPTGESLRIERSAWAPWMVQGHPRRAGLELATEERLQVRTRRPGDRIRPLGCDFGRKLKEVLIDAKVPAADRDRLPLLIADGRPVWVPGVTIDHRCRLRGSGPVWVVSWQPGVRSKSEDPTAGMLHTWTPLDG